MSNKPNAELLGIAKKWQTSNKRDAKKIINEISKHVTHQSVQELASIGRLKEMMTTKDINQLNQIRATEVLKITLKQERNEELEVHPEIITKIDEVVTKWFKQLVENDQVKKLPSLEPEWSGYSSSQQGFVEHPEAEDMFVLELKTHHYSTRVDLDFGRGDIVNINKPFSFKEYSGDWSGDTRHYHVRLGATEKHHLCPPADQTEFIQKYVSYVIHSPTTTTTTTKEKKPKEEKETKKKKKRNNTK